MPDLTIGDYEGTDLDGRPGNYCSVVPDLWFRWPCYQHDIGYAFAPRAADTELCSFLAINWKWYADMRSECSERLRFDWANPEFVACQVVALTYYVFVNTFSYPIFDEPNRIKGYDVLEGPEPDPTHPPVYRRWQACTGVYTQSAPFVSFERRVLSKTASVPRGGVLELSGRTHRRTAILFEIWDEGGGLVANHLTAPAGDNCMVAQEGERFDTTSLSAGTYRITARYYAWEASGPRLDVSYSPPRLVAYGTPTHNESVLTLVLTGGRRP